MFSDLKQTRDKIKDISTRKGFTSFWECFDYMVLADYTEFDAIMVSLEIFDGDIWGSVINARIISADDYFYDSYQLFARDDHARNNSRVEIFIMTEEAKEIYKPIYKVYIETRNEHEQPDLEKHIKSVLVNLQTTLAVNLFNDGYKQF